MIVRAMIVTLETERLYLREFQESDLDAYAEMCADEEVMQYIGAGQPLSRSESWRSMATMLGHWELRGFGLWAVEEKTSGEMIGRIGCWQPEGWIDFEIGWTLRRAFWGKGYAIEAAQASVQYAFEQLDRSHVISLIDPNNWRSIRVAERLGEKLDGSTELFDKEVLVYRLERQDWKNRS
jgi:RimJ/RimL family protein N-acetyltransferase